MGPDGAGAGCAQARLYLKRKAAVEEWQQVGHIKGHGSAKGDAGCFPLVLVAFCQLLVDIAGGGTVQELNHVDVLKRQVLRVGAVRQHVAGVRQATPSSPGGRRAYLQLGSKVLSTHVKDTSLVGGEAEYQVRRPRMGTGWAGWMGGGFKGSACGERRTWPG